jgi:Tol biopolymer transport system component
MTITRVSVDSAGNQVTSTSATPSISADGRFVAFVSETRNLDLVPGDTHNDIFVRDTLANTTTGVSVDSAGNQGNSVSRAPSISADGRFVAFESYATNLVLGDTNNQPDIFVRDLLNNSTTRVSVDSAGNQENNYSDSPSISADGRFVAFESYATNLVPGDTNNQPDIFVRDLFANTTTRVSVDAAGNEGNGKSLNPSISGDGRFVAFASSAANLVPGDTNNSYDIFVRDLSTNTITRVSVNSAGNPANNISDSPSISADGRFIAFQSFATNLVAGETNPSGEIYVHDTLTNTTTLVSVNSAGNPAKGFFYRGPSISGDGRFVGFTSYASDIVPGDTNNSYDVFVADLTNTPGGINNPPNVIINGTNSNDYLTGTSGSDTMNGFKGDDTLTGLRRNDVVYGGKGNDILYGGKGDDTLIGGLGNDTLIGGLGNDVFVLGAGLGIDTISDFTKGQNTVELINGLTFGQLSIAAGTNGALISVASSGEVLASLTGVAANLLGPANFFSV